MPQLGRRLVLQTPPPPTMPPTPVTCSRQYMQNAQAAANGTASSSIPAPAVVLCPSPPDDGGVQNFYLYLYCITAAVAVCFTLRFLYLRFTAAATASQNPAEPPPEPSWKVKTGWRVLLPDASWAVAIEQSFHGRRVVASKGGSLDRGTSSRGGSIYSAAVALGILARPLTPMLDSYSVLGSNSSGPNSVDGSFSGLAAGALVFNNTDTDAARAQPGDVEAGVGGNWPDAAVDGEPAPDAAAGAASGVEEHVHNGTLGLGAGMNGQ
jgi:hypothetical protein